MRSSALGLRRQWLRVALTSCCAALLSSGAAGGAAPSVSVDTAGLCAGRVPCFTTIQDGVDNASPGTVVDIFPSNYVENVDIGAMGSAIGGGTGNLALRTVNASGNPTPGTASIQPAGGAAIRNGAPPFAGSLSIEGLTVKSPDDNGIDLATIQGSVTLEHVISDSNGGRGFAAVIAGGNVKATDSSFSDNDGDGMIFANAVDVEFERLTVNGNADNGAIFTLSGRFRVSDSTFNSNKGGDGLLFAGATEVDFERVTASNNDENGANFTTTGIVEVDDSTFSDNKDQDGLLFSAAGDVRLMHVVAERNADNGANFTLSGNLYVGESRFNENKTGSGLQFSGAVDVSFERVACERNGDNGAIFALNRDLYVGESTFNENKAGNGLLFDAGGNVDLHHVTADRNGLNGALFAADGKVSISDSSFSDNVGQDGLLFQAALGFDGARITSSRNGRHGLIAEVGTASIFGSRFEDNEADGVNLNPNDSGSFVLRCDDIAGNARGLVIGGSTALAETNYWGSPSGPTHPSNPAGTGDSVVDSANGGAGTVDFIPFLTKPASESGQCSSHATPVLDNTALALLTLALLILPARRLARSRTVRPR